VPSTRTSWLCPDLAGGAYSALPDPGGKEAGCTIPKIPPLLLGLFGLGLQPIGPHP